MNKLLTTAFLVVFSTTVFANGEHGRNSHDNKQAQVTQSSAQSSSKSNSDTNTNVVVDTGDDEAAASSAALITAVCQSGTSGQSKSGGFSIIGSDQLCDYWKAAEMARSAHLIADKHGDEEAAEYWSGVYEWNLKEAQELLEDTEHTALAQRISDQLVKPLGLIGLLIFLI
jgi:hypothetical protein